MRDRYERLREIVIAGQGGGWRHGLGVLSARGMVAWMAAWAALPAEPEVCARAGTTSQADSSLSTSTPSLPTPRTEGGLEPACVSFLPAATPQIVAVLAQLTLAHARRTADLVQEGPAP